MHARHKKMCGIGGDGGGGGSGGGSDGDGGRDGGGDGGGKGPRSRMDEGAGADTRLTMDDSSHDDPRAVPHMLASMGIAPLQTLLPAHSAAAVRMAGGYVQLRKEQNRKWADESVARGVSLAKVGRVNEALSAYRHAIDLDPTHADAYVARGAAMANAERYLEAIADLEAGLHCQPDHPNAQKYLEETRQRLMRSEVHDRGSGPERGDGAHKAARRR